MKRAYFNSHFDSIEKEIDYSAEWENGTGYFDNAVYSVILNPGEVAKSTSTGGRRLIFVGTRFGTCVFFERFVTTEESEETAVTSNVPRRLNNIITSGSLDYSEFSRLSCPSLNIGRAVEALFGKSAYFSAVEDEYSAAVDARKKDQERAA